MKDRLSKPHVIVSFENPHIKDAESPSHEEAMEYLKSQGEDVQEMSGHYGKPERSILIQNPKNEKAIKAMAAQAGQESYITSNGKSHKMVYLNGPKKGTFIPGEGTQYFKSSPQDMYSTIKNPDGSRTYFQHQFDFSDPKSDEVSLAHPHSYDWHETSDDDIDKSDNPKAHVHTEAHGPSGNDQAGGNYSGKFHEIMGKFGTINSGKQTDLKFYHGLEHHLPKIESHIKDQGYSHYLAGGIHGKPDLANRNYNTKHLMIYDPSAGSGGDFGHEDYTKAWRLSHEMAHAETLPEINKIYGEGRRPGKLGQRTPREAKRAVHWEDMAVKKQRDIMAGLGYHMSDDEFNKERNTVLADATHRAITGKFTDPNEMGFYPHSHHIPLEHALGIIDAHAKSLGLQHDEDRLLKKSETEENPDSGLLKKSDGILEDLMKVSESYKKQVKTGIALMHPVKIQGQTHSKHGIPFHSTIKVFDKNKDKFSDVHEIARWRDFTPPDPKKTPIYPVKLKDRTGHEHYAIELGGDASRIKEHHEKFKHLGFPRTYNFTPHITIDEDVYHKLITQKPKTAHEFGIEFGHAEIRHGEETKIKYKPRGSRD